MSPSDDDSSDGALQGFFDELLGGGSANEEPQQDDSALEHQERVAEPENEPISDATADTGNDRDSWFTDDELKQGFTPSAEDWFLMCRCVCLPVSCLPKKRLPSKR